MRRVLPPDHPDVARALMMVCAARSGAIDDCRASKNKAYPPLSMQRQLELTRPVACAAEELSQDITLAAASAPNLAHQMALQYRRGDADNCRLGHPLRSVTFTGGRDCDVCCLAIPHGSSGLCCDACSYDVCKHCAAASEVPLDLSLAFDCALAAARSGQVTSQFLAGMCYALGEGVEQSDADAAEWCAVHVLHCCRFGVLNCVIAAGTAYLRRKDTRLRYSASAAASAAPAAPGSTARIA